MSILEENRKIVISIRTTPQELINIANYLQQHKIVRVNWYHTRYEFINEANNEDETTVRNINIEEGKDIL